jgi:hypothetical protein
MAPDGVYVQELERLVRRQRALIKSAESAMARVSKEAASLEERREKLTAWRQDPAVLVRTSPGWPTLIFHSALEPCGRVRTRENYRPILMGDALERHLKPCPACERRGGFRAGQE